MTPQTITFLCISLILLLEGASCQQEINQSTQPNQTSGISDKLITLYNQLTQLNENYQNYQKENDSLMSQVDDVQWNYEYETEDLSEKTLNKLNEIFTETGKQLDSQLKREKELTVLANERKDGNQEYYKYSKNLNLIEIEILRNRIDDIKAQIELKKSPLE